ncbi:MAG TPA: type IV toxin-antitoxin system AbiEi family antitoxin domain-containing protein [Solirubrobacteraceae bacterium]|nr:type IV toxin-antitoxin system AbiEi family antitoxin domain-containing protein [Solirubrobacteraceae bacterium]
MADIYTDAPDAVALHRVAYAQDGYFTVRQAREHGFSPQLLAHHVRSGRYERTRRGLYRLRDYPGSSHEEVRAAWLAVGPDRAVISHESALELHGLSDVLPNTTHLLVSRADRGLNSPPGTTLHTTKTGIGRSEVVTREGMRVTTPARSIIDAAAAGTAPEQIEIAARQALEQGLVTRRSLLARARRRGGRVTELIERAVREAES